MVLYSMLSDIAYVPFVFLLGNLLLLAYSKREFLKIGVVSAIAIIVIGNILQESCTPNVDFLVTPRSSSEIFSYAIMSLCLLCLLLREKRYIVSFMVVLSIPFQLTQFYVIPCEFIGILSFIMVVRVIKVQYTEYKVHFFASYIIASIAIMIAMSNINWKDVLPDLREDKIIPIKRVYSQDCSFIFYYELRNVEDSKYKEEMIKEIVAHGDHGKYVFIKDLCVFA